MPIVGGLPTEPGHKAEIGWTADPEDCTVHSANVKPLDFIIDKTGTYDDGVEEMGARYGELEDEGAYPRQVQIPSGNDHPQSTDENDYSTAFSSGDNATIIENKPYRSTWCRMDASTTASAGQLFRMGANGRLHKITAEAEPLSRTHLWVLLRDVSAKTIGVFTYIGLALPFSMDNYQPYTIMQQIFSSTTAAPTLDVNTDDYVEFWIRVHQKGTVDVDVLGSWEGGNVSSAGVSDKFAEVIAEGEAVDAWGIHNDADQAIPDGNDGIIVDVPILSSQAVEADDIIHIRFDIGGVNEQDFKIAGATVDFTEFDT